MADPIGVERETPQRVPPNSSEAAASNALTAPVERFDWSGLENFEFPLNDARCEALAWAPMDVRVPVAPSRFAHGGPLEGWTATLPSESRPADASS